MVRKLFWLVIVLMSGYTGRCQKKTFDLNIESDWPEIEGETIADNGVYLFYWIHKGRSDRTLLVCDTTGTVLARFPQAQNGRFLGIGNSMVILEANDSLCIFSCQTLKSKSLVGQTSYQVGNDNGRTRVASLSKEGELEILDVETGNSIRFGSVEKFSLCEDGGRCLVDQKGNDGLEYVSKVSMKEFPKCRLDTVWTGQNPINFTFARRAATAAFEASAPKDVGGEEIWYVDSNAVRAKKVVSSSSPGMDENIMISTTGLNISADGRKIFFEVEKLDRGNKGDTGFSGAHVWSSHDDVLNGEADGYPVNKRRDRTRTMVYNVGEQRVVGLTDYGTYIQYNPDGSSRYVLFFTKVNGSEGYWRKDARPDMYLVNTTNGARIALATAVVNGRPQFSPAGRYVWWFDITKKAFITYNIYTGV